MVGQILDLPVVDGHYGRMDHEWCAILRHPADPRSSLPWRHQRAILDPYCVGRLPQVQLLDTATMGLPHGCAYTPGPDRTDIRDNQVREIVAALASYLPSGA